MPGITSTLPSNGTSGGGLHSGPERKKIEVEVEVEAAQWTKNI